MSSKMGSNIGSNIGSVFRGRRAARSLMILMTNGPLPASSPETNRQRARVAQQQRAFRAVRQKLDQRENIIRRTSE